MSGLQGNEALITLSPIVRVFWCYSHYNKKLRDDLERHLSSLKQLGYITTWHDREILPGMMWEREIEVNLETADIVLPLVSDHFLASAYCQGVEMSRAVERWKQGELSILPIKITPVDYQGTLISNFQMLPTDGRAITEWNKRERAFVDVATGIRKIVERLLARKWQQLGDAYCSQEQYDLALAAYEEALHLDSQNPYFHNSKGNALFGLKRFEDAITAYSKAVDLKPDFGLAFKGMGNALDAFAPLACEKYKQLAKQSFQRAISLENAKEEKQGGFQI